MNSNFIELTEANFDQEVVNATQPVLVEFCAGWSDPCKAMAPMLESVAEDMAVPVKLARVNVEDRALGAGWFRQRYEASRKQMVRL